MGCDFFNTHSLRFSNERGLDTVLYGECCVSKNRQELPKEIFNKSGKDILDYVISNYTPTFYCKFAQQLCTLREIKRVEFCIGRSCNSLCPICRKELVIDRATDDLHWRLLNKFRNLQLESILISGSHEIFINKTRLYDWLNSISRDDFEKLDFLTNATLINDNDIKILSDYNKDPNKPNIRIMVSIDGIDRESYIRTRGIDCFDKVKENILKLKEEKLLYFVTVTASKFNFDFFPKIKPYWESLGVPYIAHFANESYDDFFLLSEEEKSQLQPYINRPG